MSRLGALGGPQAGIGRYFRLDPRLTESCRPRDFEFFNRIDPPPIDNPQTTDAREMVPAVRMPARTCSAIRLFDAAQESERHYDLVDCLDGLTFGFGHWPQAEVADFFGSVSKDADAESALISRFLQVFEAQPLVWTAFRQDAKFPDAPPDVARVREGISKLLATRKVANAPLKTKADGTCASTPPHGTSLYSDRAKWLVPAFQRAFRDPLVVAVQVRHWEKDVLEPAEVPARAFGLPEEGVFLMAFYESNPGQVSAALRTAFRRGQPPATLPAGGRDWKWDGSDRPPALSAISLDRWHALLVWQAMCPSESRQVSNSQPESEVLLRVPRAGLRAPARVEARHAERKSPRELRSRASVAPFKAIALKQVLGRRGFEVTYAGFRLPATKRVAVGDVRDGAPSLRDSRRSRCRRSWPSVSRPSPQRRRSCQRSSPIRTAFVNSAGLMTVVSSMRSAAASRSGFRLPKRVARRLAST